MYTSKPEGGNTMLRILIASSITLSIWTTVFAAEQLKNDSGQPIDLQTHTPKFEWRKGPSGENWIYDGELPVGAFYAGTEPMRSIAKPISLHNLRLLPGGPVFIRKG